MITIPGHVPYVEVNTNKTYTINCECGWVRGDDDPIHHVLNPPSLGNAVWLWWNSHIKQEIFIETRAQKEAV